MIARTVSVRACATAHRSKPSYAAGPVLTKKFAPVGYFPKAPRGLCLENFHRANAGVDSFASLQSGDGPALARRDLVVTRLEREIAFFMDAGAKPGRHAQNGG